MTENIFIEDSRQTGTVLGDLEELGIRLALDDFGTGYSSVSYLHRLPIHIVKIDQSFIADIDSFHANRAIVAAVTDRAHVLELSVTADGVETQSQRDAVNAIGCDFSQGYLYAQPMSAAAIDSHLGAASGRPLHMPAPRNLATATA